MDFDSIVHSAFAAVANGAALVYHQALATGAPVASWEVGHPVIGDLVQQGLGYATDALSRFGVPVGSIAVIGEDVLAALKALAAADATVPSVVLADVTVAGATLPAPAAA